MVFLKDCKKGRITKEDYVYKTLEIEAEGALKVGEIWYQIKMASKNPTKLDAYDHNFYLEPYLAGHQKGKARMIDTMRTVKQPEGWLTHQEYYQEYYEQNYEKRREWYLSHDYSYRG